MPCLQVTEVREVFMRASIEPLNKVDPTHGNLGATLKQSVVLNMLKGALDAGWRLLFTGKPLMIVQRHPLIEADACASLT